MLAKRTVTCSFGAFSSSSLVTNAGDKYAEMHDVQFNKSLECNAPCGRHCSEIVHPVDLIDKVL